MNYETVPRDLKAGKISHKQSSFVFARLCSCSSDGIVALVGANQNGHWHGNTRCER